MSTNSMIMLGIVILLIGFIIIVRREAEKLNKKNEKQRR